MRARVVWLEISLILVALAFAELGEVLRELRTDIVLDWFVSLAPLIWINASAVALYALVRLYFSPAFAPPATDTSRARAVSFLVPSRLSAHATSMMKTPERRNANSVEMWTPRPISETPTR